MTAGMARAEAEGLALSALGWMAAQPAIMQAKPSPIPETSLVVPRSIPCDLASLITFRQPGPPGRILR